MKFYQGKITELKENEVFVFGSNPEGRHGFGQAKVAKEKYGAQYGVGRGLRGQSYALPTKNLKSGFVEKYVSVLDGMKKEITYPQEGLKSISKELIKEAIDELYKIASENPARDFMIIYMNDASNLNGYTSKEMFEMFVINKNVPSNIVFSDSFKRMAEDMGLIEKEVQASWNIQVVNIKKTPEVKEKKDYVYCGRGSALGNPFAMENYSDEERNRVCEEYEVYIKKELELGNSKIRAQLNQIWAVAKENNGVKLGCYCAPQRCHCDTIKTIIEKKFVELKEKKTVQKEKSEKPIIP